MRKPGRFAGMAATPDGREKIETLIRAFLEAHQVHNVVLDISEERFMAFARDLDPRIAEATLPAASRKELAAAAKRAIVAALDKLFEVEIDPPGEAN